MAPWLEHESEWRIRPLHFAPHLDFTRQIWSNCEIVELGIAPILRARSGGVKLPHDASVHLRVNETVLSPVKATAQEKAMAPAELMRRGLRLAH